MSNLRKICARLGGREHPYSSRRVFLRAVTLALLLSIFGAGRARAELTTSGEVAGLKAQFMDVNGIRTRYYEMGEGEPMVLVHGGGWSGHSSANVWSKNIPLLAERFHVLAPDKIGSGMTDNPQDNNELNIQGEVDHIYDFIRAKKLGMVHLVGQSRGGGCVFFLALQHPEVVRDLVIVDSNTAAPEGPAASEESSTNCPKETDWEEWKCRIRSGTSLPDQIFDDEFLIAAKYMSLLPKSEQTVAKLKGGAGGELATTVGFRKWKAQWLERIAKEGVLQMPVLVYWGGSDPAAEIANGSALHDVIAKKNPRVWLITSNKGGHFHFREYPEEFVNNVTNFIDYWAQHADDAQITSTQSN
jgi:2-hydroxy-6-oxonona-2,4-dienedioate hydrolase